MIVSKRSIMAVTECERDELLKKKNALFKPEIKGKLTMGVN